ncbi:MAG: glycine--tRNA ligase subunit beta [Rhodospirillales bacterium 20-60-12]|nr:MAG: glycine--tRNA ligase subunit beta [Rhodospirillales bacterium 20-60-12]HQT68369.1 glycine--tRNA ligase subunit beta [Acetobacteraceae bacterium]
MATFFLELFSEEIPARMQAGAAAALAKIVTTQLASLNPAGIRLFYGPRRIAIAATLNDHTTADALELRGPRSNAPEAAIEGFLRKTQAARAELVEENGFFVLRRNIQAQPARLLIEKTLPVALAALPWPKSMRWGGSGNFAWVRPLRRIILLLNGEIVPIIVGPVTSSNLTEGHRFHASELIEVSGVDDWLDQLREAHVLADQSERRAAILAGLQHALAARALVLVDDPGLLDEVTGLVEWPAVLIGAIDAAFMDLPPEVRELSMKVNQRYFALRDASGAPAPFFAFVSNIEADDGGAAIIAGNERVLRARLSDAKHFWTLDRKSSLESRLPALDQIVFHAKIGSQGERAKRIAALAESIALSLGAKPAQAAFAARAGLLCKADLTTGMVGEFPELQGIIGGYYADDATIGAAIRTHYQPKGPSDEVPRGFVPCSVALADKCDSLFTLFAAGEQPTGSGDPFALRRAALGIIRIIIENRLRLSLTDLCGGHDDVRHFILERLRVKLRSDGDRFDILEAVLGASADSDLVRLMNRVAAVTAFLATDDGRNLLAAFKRAANILRLEEAKDKQIYQGSAFDASLLHEPAERALDTALNAAAAALKTAWDAEDYAAAMHNLAQLRAPIDRFFDAITVNAAEPDIRRNRLALLARFRQAVALIADFSKIESQGSES